MSEKRRVILHVGPEKTASSSIQYTLYKYENKNIFDKNNICYIKEWFSNNGFNIESVFSSNPYNTEHNIRFNYSNEEVDKINDDLRNTLISNLQSNTKKDLIISGESISMLNSEELTNLKNFIIENSVVDTEIIIVFFLRNPNDLISSKFQQTVKTGIAIDDLEKYDGNIKHYYCRAKKFYDVFDIENIIYVSFEEAIKYELGLVAYFFEKLGLKKPDLEKIIYVRDNESLCEEAVKICMFINQMEPTIINKKLNEKRVKDDLMHFTKIKGNKYRLEPVVVNRLISSSIDDLEWIRDNTGFNYLDEISDTSNKEIEKYYDPYTVIKVFTKSTSFIRYGVLLYYEKNNSELFNILAEIERGKYKLKVSKKISSMYIELDEITDSDITEYEDYFEIRKIDKKLYKVIFEDSKQPVEWFRELSKFLLKLNKVELAYKYITCARIIRPTGKYIVEIHEKCKRILKVQ